MASPYFDGEPVKCTKCGRDYTVGTVKGHRCVPLWVQGLVKGTFKSLAVFVFAMLVGLGFGIGVSYAFSVRPIVIGAVVHGCD